MTPPSSSPRARFGYQFSILARQWRLLLEAQLKRGGLTDATWAPLVHLQEIGDGISQKELAALVGIDGSSLVRLLDILVAKGLIERRVDNQDRRTRLIYLTDAGHGAVAAIRSVLSEAEESMLSDVAEAELAVMLQAFARITERVKAIQGTMESGR